MGSTIQTFISYLFLSGSTPLVKQIKVIQLRDYKARVALTHQLSLELVSARSVFLPVS